MRPIRRILALILLAVMLLLSGCGNPAAADPTGEPTPSAQTREPTPGPTGGSEQPPAANSQPDPETSQAPEAQPSDPAPTGQGSAGPAPDGAEPPAPGESQAVPPSNPPGVSAPPAQSSTAPGVSAPPAQSSTAPRPSPGRPASADGLACPSASGALQVIGTQLADCQGNAVQLRGISTHGIAWYPDYINEDCFRQLRQEWNVNVIRLAMYTAEYNGYCSGGDRQALKRLVRNGVEYAAAQDLYVIIDWHILSDGDPNRYADQAEAFFREMSADYADYDNVIYEICNEPNGGTSWSQIKAYAQRIIPVIRENDEDAVILVGTPNWSQYVDQAAADPITGWDNIMYTLHFYAATHTDGLRSTMTSAIDSGLPIFVSEYGICDASGSGAISETQADRWVSAMDRYGVSYVAWNLSNKAETSALIRSGCSKTSGFDEGDLSDSGKWLYRTLTGSAPPTPPAVSQPPASTPPAVSAPPAASAAPQPSQAPVTGGEGTVSFTAQLQNQWESGGQTFYQYALTVRNTGGSACARWSVAVPFSGTVSLSDGWNGTCRAEGSVLYIDSMDYNGALPAGGETGNIGFIVSGSSDLRVTGGS